MDLGERGVLEGAFVADSELKVHYRQWQPTYHLWAKLLCGFTLSLPEGDELKFNEWETVDELAEWIRKGDIKLGKHMTLLGTRQRLGLSHVRICKLFAKNIVAKGPVKAT